MPRPVTLFSGQWADLPFDTFCQKAASFGYDGVEIACSGDHFEVDKALEQDGYLQSRWDILDQHGLRCFAISNHLVGGQGDQADYSTSRRSNIEPGCSGLPRAFPGV